MNKNNLPTCKECLAIIKAHHVPQHIINHSLAVSKLAVFLAQKLKEKGEAVDVNLVRSACLLHDVVRVCDFEELDDSRFEQSVTAEDKAKWRQLQKKYKEIPHEDAAYDILKEKYPALALTIRKHRYTALLDEKETPDTWEEKLVYYADKRVMHDKIVPLEERLTEGHKRNALFYDTEAQRRITIAEVDPLIFKMEKEIFDQISLNPLDITDDFIDSNSVMDTDNLLKSPAHRITRSWKSSDKRGNLIS
ncbi:MAG: HD domain-containing protein [Planctomycetes bacterium]|nr:HD domain-containing protein [Planctomycetota bacterium]